MTVYRGRRGGSQALGQPPLRVGGGGLGEGLIAVILSGTGSDGATGARHVKAMGGTVIIQNPETAASPSHAAVAGAHDRGLSWCDLDAIGAAPVGSGERQPTRPASQTTSGFSGSFLNDLRERSGIDFASYKRPTIMRRLQRRMVATASTKLARLHPLRSPPPRRNPSG